MELEVLRKELQEAIDNGDEILLEKMYDIVNDYKDKFELPEEEIKDLDERRAKYRTGESKSYTWEEAQEIIRKKQPVK